MSSKIASTSFSTGPSNKAAAIDAYVASSKPVNTPSTSLLDTVKESAVKAAESVKNNPSLFTNIADSISLENNKLVLDEKEGMDRLTSMVGGDNGPVNGILSDIADKALESLKNMTSSKSSEPSAVDKLLGLTGSSVSGDGGIAQGSRNSAGSGLKLVNNIKTLYDTVETLTSTNDYSSARGVVDLLNTLIDDGNPLIQALDIEAQASMLGSILDKAIKLGIPNAIDTIINKIDDEKEQNKMLLRNLKVAVMYGDLAVVNKALDLVGAGGVLAIVPDIVNLLLTFYRLPPMAKTVQYGALRIALVTTLNRINVKWDKAFRTVDVAGTDVVQEIINLEPFSYASQDALLLFQTDAGRRVAAMIAPKHPSRDLIGLAQQLFPNTVFDTNVVYEAA